MGTLYKGNRKEVESLNAYIKLLRAAESVRTRLNSLLNKNGITGSQLAVLDVLYHLGTQSQKSIGNKTLKSGGNITMVIDNLEKQEYVKRERNLNDRRYFDVTITEKGKSFFEKLFPVHLASIVNEFSALSGEELIEFQRLSKKIGIKEKD